MRLRDMAKWMLVAVALTSCGDKQSSEEKAVADKASLKEKELEVELARTQAARAQAEAEKARLQAEHVSAVANAAQVVGSRAAGAAERADVDATLAAKRIRCVDHVLA